jgi:hypothetical protein
MLDFNIFTARHGEIAAQALIENLERYQGIRADNHIPLEERWNTVMSCADQYRMAA